MPTLVVGMIPGAQVEHFMEPTNPIRGGQSSEPPTDRYVSRSWKTIAFPFADFVLCGLALCGLVNTAAGFAAFNARTNSQLSEHGLTTTATQKLEWIAIFAVVSAFGFTYMLWRYHWRYRLSTLFKIGAFWCIALAAATTNTAFAIWIGGQLVLAYAIIWSSRCKKFPE
jgi:hypothetical protein